MTSSAASPDRKQQQLLELAASTGPYRLKPLLGAVPLSADGDSAGITITCLEYWDGNLYIGTSLGEVLHFVSIPSDTPDSDSTFILASRLQPSPSPDPQSQKGVQQILVLPRSNKACILCNGTVSFHSLPELSPAAGHRKLPNCIFLGARDLNAAVQDGSEADSEDGDVITITMKSRIRLVRIGSESRPTLVKDIEYPGCLTAARRSEYACVADGHSYALLDVENQQKIPLFPISSVDEAASPVVGRAGAESISGGAGDKKGNIARSSSAAANRRLEGESGEGGHGRARSLGNLGGVLGRNPRSRSRDRSEGLQAPDRGAGSLSPNADTSPARPLSFAGSPSQTPMPDKPLPPPPPALETTALNQVDLKAKEQALAPHVISPIPTEFLLTTGTGLREPGVGIFVNSDGDVVRGTLEFSQYPTVLVVDGGDPSISGIPEAPELDADGYVLAGMRKCNGDRSIGLEIQRWDATNEPKAWLPLSQPTSVFEGEEVVQSEKDTDVGLLVTQTTLQLSMPEIGEKLKLRRFLLQLTPSSELDTQVAGTKKPIQSEAARNLQEDEFGGRLGRSSTHIIAWTGNSIYWALRNPVLMKLEAAVDIVLLSSQETRLDQGKLIRYAKSIRNREARSETEFLTLDYIRQKISIVLFADLAINRDDVHPQFNEQLLLEGGVDPRVMLSMVPLLSKDIVEGGSGIWIHSGLVELMKERLPATNISLDSDELLARPEDYDVLGLIKRYLSAWRLKRGFGSISDEKQVFATVDAALLHVLLHQDQQSNIGPGGSSTLRAELYSVVDHNVDGFDRAKELLEEYRRLYVLSRLYQSRNMRGDVLETWRRIMDGEPDEGGEFTDGENEIRKYLAKTKDQGLVEEYGTYLAARNPTLGVQVFTDDTARVRLPPNQVVQLLRLRAPDSVKVYLEHLVFGKKNVKYANELISYYLDNVLHILASSSTAKTTLAESYNTYRVLPSPKPTYRQFITDVSDSPPWWLDRLRLLELLGGSHGAGFSYDVPRVLARIEPFEAFLVPESIILDGRQGRHQQALRLLTHGLGDYHTAINYCLLGGASIFHPTTASSDNSSSPTKPPTREEQTLLFKHLLREFLQISDEDARIERTSELLGRFGAWFDVQDTLAAVPDDWAVETVSAFLVSALRRLVQERVETGVVKALSGAENLRISAMVGEECEKRGPVVVPMMNTPDSMA